MKYLNIVFFSFFSVLLLFSKSTDEADNKIKITIIGQVEENNQNALSFIETVEKFDLDYPDVEVKWELLDQDNYFQTLSAYLSGNNQLDIAFVKNNNEYLNLLTNYDENIDQIDFIDSTTFEENSLKSYNSLGQLFTIPYGKYIDTVMYINNDLLNTIKQSPAKTYEELLVQQEIIHEYNRYLISYPIASTWNNSVLLYSLFISRYGGADYISRLISGMSNFTDEPSLLALNAIKLLGDDLILSDIPSETDYNKSLELFNSGQYLYMLDGLWREDFITLPNYSTSNFVELTGELFPGTANGGYTYGFSIMKSAITNPTKKDYVIELYNRLYGKNAADIRSKEQSIISVLKDNNQEVDPGLKEKLELFSTLSSVVPTLSDYFSSNVIQSLNLGISDLLNDNITPEELAQNIQDVYQKENPPIIGIKTVEEL